MTRGALLLACALAGAFSTGCVNLTRFQLRELSPGIYEGGKPVTAGQFELLRAHRVRTILSLEVFPWDVLPESRLAREYGLLYFDVPILAAPLPPPEKRIKEALLVLSNPSLRPIYLHCFLGEDRATLVLGLYRVYYEGWTPEAAWREIIREGFHVRWSLRGFESYFWSHTRKPSWVKRTSTPLHKSEAERSSNPETRNPNSAKPQP